MCHTPAYGDFFPKFAVCRQILRFGAKKSGKKAGIRRFCPRLSSVLPFCFFARGRQPSHLPCAPKEKCRCSPQPVQLSDVPKWNTPFFGRFSHVCTNEVYRRYDNAALLFNIFKQPRLSIRVLSVIEYHQCLQVRPTPNRREYRVQQGLGGP